jgi:hypothetical protein
MRWDALFADLEARAAALSAGERDAELADRTRSEVDRLRLVDRLRPAVGAQLRLSCTGGLALTGRLGRVHPEWLLLAEDGGREAVVALTAVTSISGLAALAAAPDTMSVVDSRLGLASALRGIARDRSPVRLHLSDGTVLDGTLDRAAADFVDVAVHPVGEVRRRSAVSQRLVVATDAVVALRRDG